MSETLDRCRLMLAAGPGICNLTALRAALEGGDVASVILCDREDDPSSFLEYCSEAVKLAQAAGAAALISEDTQIMGRSEADGLYLQQNFGNSSDRIARFSPQKIVGCGGMMNRDTALRIGELYPDFVVFGKVGRDIKPDPHPKNLAIAGWWSEFVELPGVVPGGSSVESVKAVSETGIDFVLLEKAVFASDLSPKESVKRANEILEQYSPRFSEMEE